MEIYQINSIQPDQQIISKAVKVLKESGVVIYPTDTIYGLGCDIFNKKAIAKIYQLKKRERRKPMSIICQDLKQISEYAQLSNLAYRLLKKVLPGPYTFILKASPKTPKTFIAQNKTVGVRIPNNQVCQELVKKLGNPIITTSVNLQKEEPCVDPNQLDENFKNRIDLILDAGCLDNEPSTIIDLTEEENPRILRQGKGDTSIL